MQDLKNILINPSAPVKQAIHMIDSTGVQGLVVVDACKRLCGVLTDGDIRRGLINGVSLDDPLDRVMNAKPVYAKDSTSRDALGAIMKRKSLQLLPIVNDDGIVTSVKVLREVIQCGERDNWVVLMAGGLGRRLQPLTQSYPKPLLKFGNKPILEHILESFIEQGFKNFYVAVNYMADMIRNHFADGSRWGVNISYLSEDNPLGTAGALSMLPGQADKPVIVMNGDILTKINFTEVLDFHAGKKADATMCVREYSYQIPYGIAHCRGRHLLNIEEKPVQRFWVSGGVYVLSPAAINVIPQNEYCDMPNLFKELIKRSLKTKVFPINDYWLDVGTMSDFERAQGEYQAHFGNR